MRRQRLSRPGSSGSWKSPGPSQHRLKAKYERGDYSRALGYGFVIIFEHEESAFNEGRFFFVLRAYLEEFTYI